MDYTKNVENKFDLTEMKPGDEFLGCPYCGFNLKPQQAASPSCPDCGKRLYIYKVTKNDLLGYKGSPIKFTRFT